MTAIRDAILIGHATPEENALMVWLGGRLAALGAASCPSAWELLQRKAMLEPTDFSAGPDGAINVWVHQTVRDLKGSVLSDRVVGHIFQGGRPDPALRYPLIPYCINSN
jgi:hypothetical protein